MKTSKAAALLYHEMMEHFQQESASKTALLESLKEELATFRVQYEELQKAHAEEMAALRESHRMELEKLRESYEGKMVQMQESFEKRLDHMAEVNACMSMQLSDALSSGKLARVKKYARSSEQRARLNNRHGSNNRKQEEDDSDGTPPPPESPSDATPSALPAPKPKPRRNTMNGTPEGKMHFDDVVEHELHENYNLPEDARLLPGLNWYEVIEYIPGRIVCHRYPYERYVINNPDIEDRECFGDTLPDNIRALRPAKGCPLSASLMAFVMMQRYAYHLPQKRVSMMLRDMGAKIPRSTLNRFYRQGANTLLALLGATFRAEVNRGSYFMVDETLEVVGVDDRNLGRRYLNKYLWEFYNRDKNLVEYVYEDGSRGQKVLLEFFGDECGQLSFRISCDGYNAYRLFDSDKYPDIEVIGCWTHARRNFVDAMNDCPKVCEEVLDLIGGLFEVEAECREAGLDSDGRLKRRESKSKGILNLIKAHMETMWNDVGLMSVALLKKAVGYVRNQWDHLSNIINSGIPEISNNFAEQRVKPIKLSMKNVQNIGSESAAKRHAFMHSLTESCRLNHIDIADYFKEVFSKARSALSPEELAGLLPNHYRCAKC